MSSKKLSTRTPTFSTTEDIFSKKYKAKERNALNRQRNVELKKYKCQLCKHCFTDQSKLNKHLKLSVCEKANDLIPPHLDYKAEKIKFLTSVLEERIIRIAKEKEFKAKERKRKQKEQRQRNVELKRFECQLCKYCFTNAIKLNNHLKFGVCVRKNEKLANKSQERNIVTEETELFTYGRKIMICFQCHERFTDFALLIEHKKINHPRQKGELHLPSAPVKKDMICFKCEKRFTCYKALVAHKNIEHPDRHSVRKLTCYWCDSQFRTQYMMRRHTVLSHAFNCEACMKLLLTWEEFKKHAKYCQFSRENYEEFATRYGFDPKQEDV